MGKDVEPNRVEFLHAAVHDNANKSWLDMSNRKPICTCFFWQIPFNSGQLKITTLTYILVDVNSWNMSNLEPIFKLESRAPLNVQL